MLRTTALALLLGVAACGPTPDFEPFESYAAGETAIYGYVTDLYGCGLAGAQVFTPASDLATVTDGQGRYRLRLAAMSSHRLAARLDGFGRDTADVQVGPSPQRHDFELVPDPDCGDEPCPIYRPPCPQPL